MSQFKLYKHFISTNYANLKTKIDDFRKVNFKKKETRNKNQEPYV